MNDVLIWKTILSQIMKTKNDPDEGGNLKSGSMESNLLYYSRKAGKCKARRNCMKI